VLGVGVGIFVIFFFFIVLVVVWFLSLHCAKAEKLFSRILALLVFIIVLLILIFAPRDSQYEKSTVRKVRMSCCGVSVLTCKLLGVWFNPTIHVDAIRS
jgi:small-conductance mechanosensitive channel